MSRAPHLVDGRQNQLRYGNTVLRDVLVDDDLWYPFEDWGMGDAAEFIAEEFEVTREAMDHFALESHQKAIAAMDGASPCHESPRPTTKHRGALSRRN